MKHLFFFLILTSFSFLTFAQSGKITGKVVDGGTGQPLAGATLFLIEKSKTDIADQGGRFSFGKLTAGSYSVKCSYTGYNEKTVDEVIVKDNDITEITISLDIKKALDAVVLQSKRSARVETVASLLQVQKNYAGVSDGITSETIKKTPDRIISDVLKRVSGASIQDDRFAIIRGLNDRYNAAFINGAPLPSTESDRKAFAFDIFPSSILDNLVIYKTATPDKSGEFAGGIIDITTKSILPKSFTSLTFGGSYNSIITGNTRYYSENKGKKDWIGIDDGTRAMPSGLPSPAELKSLSADKRAELAKLFGNYKWGIMNRVAGPNYNIQLSKGFNIERKQKEFIGALFSLNYNHSYTLNEGERNSYDFDLTAPAGSQLNQKARYRDSVYNDEIVLAILGNFSIKINNRNSLSWKNNLSINTDNKLIRRIGAPDFTADSTIFIKENVRWYTSNKIYSSQLSGEHTVGKKKTKINWLAAYSNVDRKIPNLSRTSYTGTYPDVNSVFANFSSGPPLQTVGSGTMFFADSKENIKSIKAELSQPYTFLKNAQNSFKIGAGYQIRERDFTSRVLGFAPYNGGAVNFDFSLFNLSEDQIFLPQHLGLMKNGKGGFLLNDGTLSNSDYSASSGLTNAFIMNDQRFLKKFRLIYGVRLERFNQKLNSVKNLRDTVSLNSVISDYLPSVNFVYAATPKMNLRLSYSQTINRPEFRELAPFLFYDYVTSYTYEGQESLKRAKISNYDFRYEFFPGKAQVFSASAFYKEFDNPIEIVTIPNTSSQTIYINSKSAKIYGVEAEFRTLLSTLFGIKREGSFLSRFTMSANAAYIKSKVILGELFSFSPDQLVTDRALQGQSPYLVNGSMAYSDERTGFSTTLSVNRVGDRILVGGTYRDADIYEKARTLMDFQMSKSFLKGAIELRFTAKDILAQRISYYFDFDKSKSYTQADRFFSSNAAPRVFSCSATFKL
ncbi:MAG: TonB-dependent receptor [Bacteroidetes bacterium]|nr:TonB-dependent receptor [Bacteroidota bacterium]